MCTFRWSLLICTVKINVEKLVVEFEEEHEDLDDIEDLVSELPDSTPRFVVYTYCLFFILLTLQY